MKRDNHGTENDWKVNAVLEKYGVLPLNSPEYYAQYNGGIEKCNSEIKQWIRNSNEKTNDFSVLAKLAAHDLNHKSRPKLNGNVSCQVFHSKRFKMSNRERREIFNLILNKATDIMFKVGVNDERTRMWTWRKTLVAFLVSRGYIKILRQGDKSVI